MKIEIKEFEPGFFEAIVHSRDEKFNNICATGTSLIDVLENLEYQLIQRRPNIS